MVKLENSRSHMMEDTRAYGIPDIELAGQQGGTVNPSNFLGHDLILLFCPAEPLAAASELASFNSLADALAYNDAFMIAVCCAEAGSPASRILISTDAERARDAFGKCLDGAKRLHTDQGGVLLFGRGGCLRQSWHGTGHAREVIQALGERM
jgi:peroxiredoxin